MEKTAKTAMKSLAERDQQHIWHPFTQMQTAPTPIVVTKGKGALLYDENGNEYIDAVASWWMNLHGHSHPYIAERLYEQATTLEHVIFADFTHPPAVHLAERLIKKLPDNQNRVFFSDNGSTAVEVGIKMAIQYWYNHGKSKTRFIALDGSYHGDTFGAMSVGSRSVFSKPFDEHLFHVDFLPLPVGDDVENCLTILQKLVAENDDIAGIIVEPLVQGAGGMRMYSPEVLDEIYGIARAGEVLCIADEVMVGFGRTGQLFATQSLKNVPDIYCLSKGLTGGTMALGLTTCTEEIYEAFLSNDRTRAFFHGHSCTGNPLACSVALASLDLMERPETWDNINRIIASHEAFQKRLSQYTEATNIRQTGVILAFDFVPPSTGEQTSYFSNWRDIIWNFFIDRGFLLRPLGNTIYILPPYCITVEQLNSIYDVIELFLREGYKKSI